MPISVKEQQSYITHQLLRLGPFNVYPVNHPRKTLQSDSRLVAIRIHLELQDILCQPSMEKPGSVLVSGYIRGQVYIHQTQRNGTPIINSVEQKPLTIEGMWNPLSKELHMVGCGPPNFSPLLFPSTTLGRRHCNWKLHLKSVLHEIVTKDTPEDRCWAASMKHLDIQSTSHPCDLQEQGALVWLLSPHFAQSSMSTGTPTCPRRSCWRARTESVLPPNMGWNSRLWKKIAATCFTPTWTLMWLPSPW